jgi:hypothetical protein
VKISINSVFYFCAPILDITAFNRTIDMILVVIIGFIGLLIGAFIQRMNMKDDIERLRYQRYNYARSHILDARNQFKGLSVEANNISHDPDYQEAVRSYHVTASEVWNRASQCMEYRLEDIDSEEITEKMRKDDNIRSAFE